MSKVLVTGGNGFVAAQVIIAALQNGYEVVATVRAPQKGEDTKSALAKRVGDKISNLSFAIVPKIEADDAFDEVIKANSFVAILHTATPFHYNITDPRELLDPAIGSTKSLLLSVKKFGPTVKRVVITSSFASIVDHRKGVRPGYVYSEKDWNPVTWEIATAGDPGDAYYGAKTLAEKAAWEFLETEKPHFDIVSINPPMTYGEVAQYVPNANQLNTSSAQLYKTLYGIYTEISPQIIMIWTDVGVLGLAHVLAISKPEAANKRIIIASDAPFSHKQFSDIFSKNYPELAPGIPTKLPPGVDSQTGFPTDGSFTADNSLSKSVLGLTYPTLEETLVRFAESVKSLEK